jgi:hypothetical protein
MSFPNYSFSDEIAAPSDLGIRREGSRDAILDAITGANYYMDTMGFGAPTGLAKLRGGVFAAQQPLGIRFFVNTGLQCSNGAPMHEYMSTIPQGDSLGKSVAAGLQKMQLPPMQGLVPGILEDAKAALNPETLVSMQGNSYPACKKVRKPVGDSRNRIQSQYDPNQKWIEGPVQMQNGIPTQEQWVLDRWITKEEWMAEPKTEGRPSSKPLSGNPKTQGVSECFMNPDSLDTSQITAAVLLGIFASASMYVYFRK